MTRAKITVTVNGREYEGDVEARLLLSDFIREHLGLTGTHVGCEHGVCGACTIVFNGATARSCLMLAVQAHGADITTIEGVAKDGVLHPVQQAFRDQHGLQCGYCTPGFVVVLYDLLERNPSPTEEEIKEAIGWQPVPLYGLRESVARINGVGRAPAAGAARGRRLNLA